MPKRVIAKSDLPLIKEALTSDFAPISKPSYSIADVFLAVTDFLRGKEEHHCEKVYGFLDTPYSVESEITVNKEDIILCAQKMDTSKFLAPYYMVGDKKIGPADFLMAAIDVLLGADTVKITPKAPLPSLDVMPRLRDVNFKGGWIQMESFKDNYISKRLRLQSWTMRF